MDLTEKNSKTKILKSLLKAMMIILLSSLPYIHDLITIRDGNYKGWVPDWGIQNFLTDYNGYVLGFSTYRVFIYTIFSTYFYSFGLGRLVFLTLKTDFTDLFY